MVGPIARIGTPGTSQYRVDWSPIAKGYSDFGRGIGDMVKGIRDLDGRKKQAEENLTARGNDVFRRRRSSKFLSEAA